MGEERDAVISFEQARSGRSTCRASGEPIASGEWRVGFETFLGGRIATAWMKPLPFLRDCCRVEYCLNQGNQGACKASKHKFSRGDVRFVCTAGDPQKKIYLSLAAAGAQLQPVLQHVVRRDFSPTSIAGLEGLAAEDRREFYEAFNVSKATATRFDKRHPAQPSLPGRSPSAAAAAAKAGAAAAEEEAEAAAEDEAAQGGEGGRPAKRARSAVAASTAEGEGAGEAAADEAGPAGVAAQQGEGKNGTTERVAVGSEQGLTEYERRRLEQIRKNRERMMALNLPALASELLPPPKPTAAAAAKHKGVSRKRISEVLPRRESSRLRGIAADGSQVHSERQGEVVVVAGEVIRRYASGSMAEEQAPQERHPQAELVFESCNCGHDTDEDFIQLLAHAASSVDAVSSDAGHASGERNSDKKKRSGGGSESGGQGGNKPSSSMSGGPARLLGAADMARLRLAADDVAKVTKEATTHLAFHPITDTLIIACADKRGNVGLWHVNEGDYQLPPAARSTGPILHHKQDEGEGAKDGKPAAAGTEALSLDTPGGDGGNGSNADGGGSQEFDGVLSLVPQHYQYICGLKWAGGSGRGAALYTAAYDGSLRRMDLGRGVSELIVSSENDEYSCMDVTVDGWTALLGDNEGALQMVDVRAGRAQGAALMVHRKKINTISIEPTQEQVFATASTDTLIQLWDRRKLVPGKPLATANHAQTCQAAVFAPDGSRRLVSTSFDNTLRLWDGGNGLSPLLTIPHDNNTGRWVLPFRAAWNAAGDGVVVGNMGRCVDCFDASTGVMTAQLQSEHMTAIPSRNAVHPVVPVLAAATNSGRIHVFRQ